MPATSELTPAAVAAAAGALRPVIRETPVEHSERLSADLGTDVWLKREDLQIGRSYKVRGAYNLISSLTDSERRLGVTCASAGNHAQGVAFSCRALGIRGKVFVPTSTPRQKRDRITAIGRPWVDLVLAGANYDEASTAALDDADATGSIYVHPFDDVRTIAGQGTVAVDLSEQCGDGMGTVIVPVGGGGLIAGIAVWLAEHAPAVRIVGAEPAGAASMAAALAAGGPVPSRARGLLRGRSRGRHRRPIDLPRRLGAGRRDGERARGGRMHGAPGPLPDRGDHRRTGGRAGQRGSPPISPGRRAGGVHRLGRQQRRQPLRRHRGAILALRGTQALLLGHVPSRAGCPAPIPRRHPRPR